MMRLLHALGLLWKGSIARQLMLGIALVHAVMLTVFVVDLVNRQAAFLLQESTGKAQALARMLAANGSSWMLANDVAGMAEVIASQGGYPGLRYAMFLDVQGRLLGHQERTLVGQFVDDPVSLRLFQVGHPPRITVLVDDAQLVDVAAPVLANDVLIGWARVAVSRADIAAGLAAVTRDGLIYTLLAILVGLVFAGFMGRGLTAGIRRLADFTNRLSAGERNLQCELDRPDELGQLSLDLQHMLTTLVQRERDLRVMHQQLQRDEERLRFALEGARDGLWDWDLSTNAVYMSPAWKAMLGYRDEELPSTFASWEDNVHPDDLPRVREMIAAHLSGQGPFEVPHRLHHKDGGWRWILARGRATFDVSGTPIRMVGTHVDVTEQLALQESLACERERALVTLRSIADGVITTDATGCIEFLNPIAEHLTGWTTVEAAGLALEEVFVALRDDQERTLDNPVKRCLEEDRAIPPGRQVLLLNRAGREIPIQDSAAPIHDGAGAVIGVVLVFHDATVAREMQHRYEHQALHDELTGLWNRRAFDDRLADVTAAAMRGDGQHVLVYIDLDQFKVINDTVGHFAGDQMLHQVAAMIAHHVRESDMLARLGGDEFGLLLVGCDIAHATSVVEKIRQAMVDYRFIWEGQAFLVGASFGLALLDADVADPNVLSLADLACHSAKEQGRNRLHVYRPDDSDLSARRTQMQWVSRIKQGIETGRLILYGQTIKPLHPAAERPGYIEILVRLLDDDGRLVAPGVFIPAAERYGLMPSVDRAVMKMAVTWLAQQAPTVCIAINLSGASLGDVALLHEIEAELDARPDLGARLCFEITETAAIGNLADATGFMHRLKGRAVKFSLDDFGSGLSSFGYLKTLPVDFLKIDGEFVCDLLDDPLDAAMVEAISQVCKVIGIASIAEFVENDRVAQRLDELGVDYVQGFGIARPVPLAELAG